jgi:hypothetical protein
VLNGDAGGAGSRSKASKRRGLVPYQEQSGRINVELTLRIADKCNAIQYHVRRIVASHHIDNNAVVGHGCNLRLWMCYPLERKRKKGLLPGAGGR